MLCPVRGKVSNGASQIFAQFMTTLEKILVGIIGIILVGAVLGTGTVQFQNIGTGGNKGISLYEQERLSPVPTISDENLTKSEELAVPPVNDKAPAESSSRLVIRSGNLNLVVQDIWGTGKKIIEFAEGQGGYVVSSTISEIEEVPTGTVVIRVPEDKFDTTMDFIKALAKKVEYEGRTGEDVTEEYVDLEAKLKALQAKRDQFYEILKKATTIEDTLKVYDKIEEVQTEINQTEGRMNYLKQSAKLAKISINLALSEDLLPIPPGEEWRPGYIAKMAWQETARFWRQVSYGFINFFVYHLLTWIVIVGVLTLILWRPLKRFFKKLGEGKKEVKGSVASATQETPGSAIGSLICGVLAALLMFNQYQWGLILGIAAIILGLKDRQNGYAKAGLILGIIAVGLIILGIITRGGQIYY